MDTLVKNGRSTTANLEINRNNAKYSIRDFLYHSQSLPEQLIDFLIEQKTGVPICTAIISLDLKTLHYTSTAIFKLKPDKTFNGNETVHPTPFEIIKARLSLSPESSINVKILSIPLRTNDRFCLFFRDESGKRERSENKNGRSRKRNFAMTFVKLTPREKEVARMVAVGKTSVQLAEELNIAKDTVKNHRKNIRRKLNITTRAEQMKMNEWLRNTDAVR